MGKFAQLLGINVTGSVRIELDKREYFAGEFLRGVAYVNVQRSVEAEELVVMLTGTEKVTWREQRGNENAYSHDSIDFFGQQIVLTRLPAIYEPGDYVYPFQYQLPSALPGVTSSRGSRLCGTLKTDCVKVSYKLDVRLRAHGFFTADFAAHYVLQIHAMIPPLEQQRVGFERSGSAPVKLLTFIHQGTCELSAVLLQSTAARGATVAVRATVLNNSTRKLNAVVLELEQTIDVFQARDNAVRVVHAVKVPGVGPGEHFHGVLELRVPHELPPTCTSATLFAVHYQLRVCCKFTCCPSPWLDLPLVVLAHAVNSYRSASTAQLQDVPIAIPVVAC